MKILLSACIGFAIATALTFFLVVPQVKRNWRAQGQTEGFLKAQLQTYRIAEKYFPEQPVNCKDVSIIAGAKPAVIIVVDCGNYKTLRVADD